MEGPDAHAQRAQRGSQHARQGACLADKMAQINMSWALLRYRTAERWLYACWPGLGLPLVVKREVPDLHRQPVYTVDRSAFELTVPYWNGSLRPGQPCGAAACQAGSSGGSQRTNDDGHRLVLADGSLAALDLQQQLEAAEEGHGTHGSQGGCLVRSATACLVQEAAEVGLGLAGAAQLAHQVVVVGVCTQLDLLQRAM